MVVAHPTGTHLLQADPNPLVISVRIELTPSRAHIHTHTHSRVRYRSYSICTHTRTRRYERVLKKGRPLPKVFDEHAVHTVSTVCVCVCTCLCRVHVDAINIMEWKKVLAPHTQAAKLCRHTYYKKCTHTVDVTDQPHVIAAGQRAVAGKQLVGALQVHHCMVSIHMLYLTLRYP